MSDNFYLKLRKTTQENQRKGAFPFPTYAQALFSQVLVSRKVISSSFERPALRTPVALRGPEVAEPVKAGPVAAKTGTEEMEQQASQEVSEKKKLFQSLDQFIDDKINGDSSGKVTFPGGEVSRDKSINFTNATKVQLSDLEDLAGDRPIIFDYDSFESDDLSILFVGERPKDFNEDHPRADLLSKMISAMKLRDSEFCRIFLSKDPEMAIAEWYQVLKLLDGRMQICIVPLGAKACNTILGTKERLSKIHGQEFNFRLVGKKTEIDLSVYPIFHPDFLQINPNMKRSTWIDLQKVMTHLGIS